MKISLSHTVSFEGKKIKELTLPEYLSVGMSIAIQKLKDIDNQVDFDIAMMALFCEMPEDFIITIPKIDYQFIEEYIIQLLKSSSKKNVPQHPRKRNRSKKDHKNASR